MAVAHSILAKLERGRRLIKPTGYLYGLLGGCNSRGINFINGDLPNCITTSLLGKDFTIEGCSFINLMGTNIANDDHSTIYGTSAQTKVRNCFSKCPLQMQS